MERKSEATVMGHREANVKYTVSRVLTEGDGQRPVFLNE